MTFDHKDAIFSYLDRPGVPLRRLHFEHAGQRKECLPILDHVRDARPGHSWGQSFDQHVDEALTLFGFECFI